MNGHTLVLGALWLGTASVCICEQHRLRVVVFDYAEVPEVVLDSAVELGRQVFQQAGVETSWFVCHHFVNSLENCVLPPAGIYMRVNVTQQTSGLLSRNTEYLGWANVDTVVDRHPTAYAFYDCVRKLASETGQSVSDVLAAVLVHEISHLLGLGHSNLGVMRANLGQLRQTPVTWFTARQTQQLHDGLSALNGILLTRVP